MKRVDYYLTDSQYEYLKAKSDFTEITVSELIRRAVDAWIKEDKKENDKTISA